MFWPPRSTLAPLAQLRIALGTAAGILALACLSGLALHWQPPASWLLAPLGASAVLVFAAPTSPMAQPWPVIGGNLISLLTGYALAGWVAQPYLAIGLAIGCAMGAMLLLRCVHPPGGAMALVGAIAQQAGTPLRPGLALMDGLILLATAVLFHRLTGQVYPMRHPARPANPAHTADLQVIDATLARLNHLVDIDRDELLALLDTFRRDALRLRMARVTAADIMAKPLVTVTTEASLALAWRTMRRRNIKVLPVLDGSGALSGLLSRTDLLRAARRSAGRSLLVALGVWSPTQVWRRVRAAEIMSTEIRSVSAQMLIGELLPLFASTGHHHLPVLGADNRPIGMITQRDVLRALSATG